MTCRTIASWTAQSERVLSELINSEWDLRGYRAFLSASKLTFGRIPKPPKLDAECWAVLVNTYRETTSIYETHFTLQFCVGLTCDGLESYFQVLEDSRYLSTSIRQRKEDVDRKTSHVLIPAAGFAEPKCLEWIKTLAVPPWH